MRQIQNKTRSDEEETESKKIVEVDKKKIERAMENRNNMSGFWSFKDHIHLNKQGLILFK